MQDCVSVFVEKFSKKKNKFVLIYGMNMFQTEIKIKDLNRPVPILVLTFSRKSFQGCCDGPEYL